MNLEEKTISKTHIYTGKIISLDTLTVKLSDGEESTRDIISHPGASVIVPVDDNGEVYMVRQYRKPIEMISLEVPAGKLDHEEDPEVCAHRELKEETGLTAKNMKYLTSIHSTPGFSNEVLHIYMATGLEEGEANADKDEFLSTEKIHINKLVEMINNREITDAKTIIGILMADRLVNG